jgi:hypothetical protein
MTIKRVLINSTEVACSDRIPARLKRRDSCNSKCHFLALFSKHISTYGIHKIYGIPVTMCLESRGSNLNLFLVSEILGDIVIFYKRQLGTFAQVSKWYLLIYIKCTF